jgi:FKBP-type peptidyl-prolyl cis-trans isomerase
MICRKNFHPCFVFLSLTFYSCHLKENEKPVPEAEVKEHFIEANKMMVHDEAKDIEEFISRHQWKMQTTGTGLHYDIYEKGNGDKYPQKQNIISIAYKIYLLDGTLCYSADETKPLKFILGTNTQPRGLEEGLRMMTAGAKARFVVPDHLAFGVLGDKEKIPGFSAVYYDVILLSIDE